MPTYHSQSSPPPLPGIRRPSGSQPPPLPGKRADNRAPKPGLLTLEELERFKNLLVFAQVTVEGYFAGKHRSPYRGSSAEFADYKEYVPGDDLGRIDWRAYGRTKKLYIRQYEDETDMVVYLLVDTSASMRYAGGGRQMKYQLAAKVAAALSYLVMNQGDKAALGLFSDSLKTFLPPGGTRRHLHKLVTTLETVMPQAGTGIVQALTECGPVFKKRGKLVILSDFLTDQAALFDALGQFVHRRFEVLLLHVLDPDEMHLPVQNLARFIDLETGQEVEVDPEEIRAHYQVHRKQIVDNLGREANLRRINHRLVDTRRPYLDAIEAYLGFRGNQSFSPG
jgi:uncharacterized protein (DUF58 family)